MERIVIGVAGMSCQKCVHSVTTVLQALPGIDHVEVSLDAGQASLAYDPAKVGVAQIKAVIEDAGFDVS